MGVEGTLSPMELLRKSVEAQREWRKVWEELVDKGEIEQTTWTLDNGKELDFYKLNGDIVKDTKLSDAFQMLQNWNLLGDVNQDTFFEMNIGGKDYIFRLKRDKNNQIMVYDEKGKPPKYEDIFKIFKKYVDKGVTNYNQLAEQMLQSSKEKIGEQSQFTFKNADELQKNMRDLMVVGQVAEAAAMSDDYFDFVEEMYNDVKISESYTEERVWRERIDRLFNIQNREIFSNLGEYDTLHSLVKEAIQPDISDDDLDRLKKEIQDITPDPSVVFFDELAKSAGDEEAIKDLLDQLSVEEPSDEQYKAIEEAAETLSSSNDPNEIEDAKKTVLDNIPDLSDDFYGQLKRITLDSADYARNENQNLWDKLIATTHKIEGQTFQKVGRVPGQDELFRRTLKIIATDPKVTDFNPKFKELFPIHLAQGTSKGRKRLFGEGYEDVAEPDQEAIKKIRRDIKAVAAAEPDSESIKDSVEEEMDTSACSQAARLATACSRAKKLKVIEDSMEWNGDKMTFETIDEEGIRVKHQVEIDINDMSLPKYVQEAMANLKELGVQKEDLDRPPSPEDPVSKGVGIYGAFVGILSSAQYLQRGEYGEAAFSATQAVYSIGGMVGFNKAVEEASAKAFAKLMGFTADKEGVEKVMEKMVDVAAKAVGETTARALTEFTAAIPFIGLAFDLYFVAEDIKDLQDKNSNTPEFLKVAHLVLDVEITALSLVESFAPELSEFTEPAIIALTIIRISIDDFYMDIKRELSKAKGKGFVDHIWALYKGYKEGIIDVLTLGLYTQLKSLQEQVEFDNELLQNMTDPAKYFEYRTSDQGGDLDFTAGSVSQYGGFLDVTMHNNGSVTMVMAEVPDEDGLPQTIVKTFDFPRPVQEIILGVGEVETPEYIQEKAYLWLFIPIKTEDVIADLDEHASSRYGVYTGNSADNTFYALQTQPDVKPSSDGKSQAIHDLYEYLHDFKLRGYNKPQAIHGSHVDQMKRDLSPVMTKQVEKVGEKAMVTFRKAIKKRSTRKKKDKVHLTVDGHVKRSLNTVDECDDPNAASNVSLYLKSYTYDLYGGKGEDKFFLGPQQAQVSGGDGIDLYYLQPSGGKTIIDNFAIDEAIDTLYFNVTYENIKCTRHDWDLLIGYCDTHIVRISNWFNHDHNEFYRHIHILSKDGILMEVTETEIEKGSYKISCDAVIVDKTGSEEGQVIALTGSFSHVTNVYGSNFSDHVIGNDLANLISLGTGNDQMEGMGGQDIYVIGKDHGDDTINNYAEDLVDDTVIFAVEFTDIEAKKDQYDLVLYDRKNKSSSSLRLKQWFSSSLYQHANFMSADYVHFTVELNSTGVPLMVPITIDLGKFKFGVVIDLNNSRNNVNYTANKEEMNDVKSIFDSPYNDVLRGNALGNFLTCTKGADTLRGNSGKDTYVTDINCTSLSIDNLDPDRNLDLLLIRCLHNDLSLDVVQNSLIIRCTNHDRQQLNVNLMNWFKGLDYQHLYIKSVDLITSSLPSNMSEYENYKGKPVPIEIEKNEGCENQIKDIDLRMTEYQKVERFEASSNSCSYSVYGNSINNYIDPGPGNPFGYRHVEGGNGTDTYIMGHNYGMLNLINNYATDNRTDHLKFQVIFNDIVAQREEEDVILTSKSQNDSVQVVVSNYYHSYLYRHMVVETADNFMFRFAEEYPYIEVIMVDFSASKYGQIISLHENTSFKDAIIVIGSKTAPNHIEGGACSQQIIGGNQSDTIFGGPEEEDLVGAGGNDEIHGGDGDDRIYGGDGDDVLYGNEGQNSFLGGLGADMIKGGNESDYIVFSGVDFGGVTVNLQVGIGMDADAKDDRYELVDHILSSEYDDVLVGSDEPNIIRSYAGNDIIFSFGGNDILHGGAGSDLYMLEDASGSKTINNFATQEELDLVSLKNYMSDRVCYLYLEEDLIMSISFDVNSQDSTSRIMTQEDYLEITIAFALKNSTYRHLLFFFNDTLLYIEDYEETGHQLGTIYRQVVGGFFLHINCTGESRICVSINFTVASSSEAPPDMYTLSLVQITHNETIYHALSYLYHGGKQIIQFDNLKSGIENNFMGYISSCGSSIAASPFVTAVTFPNPPMDLVVDAVVFEGFTIHWSPPSNTTDPLASNYSFVIKVLREEEGEPMVFESNDTEFTIYSLLPQTMYKVLLYSKSHNTTGRHATGVTVTTDNHTCSNLADLPETLYIQNFERNDQDLLIANLSCIKGYQLIGNPIVVCDDPNSPIPTCDSLACYIPLVANATLLSTEFNNDTNRPLEGDTLVWRCNNRYEVSVDVTVFSSMCYQHQWVPKPAKCKLKPKCSGVHPPSNGNVSPTIVYVDENVTYHCNHGYALVGPMVKHCMRDDTGSVYLTPTASVFCNHTHCPSPQPQMDGHYSRSPPFYEDDNVTLTCFTGYYVTNRLQHPEKGEYQCKGGMWNTTIRLCRKMVHATEVVEKIQIIQCKLKWAFSAWQNAGVEMDATHKSIGCHQIGGTGYDWTIGGIDQCSRSFELTLGASEYEGVLTVSDSEEAGSTSYVCIESTIVAASLCDLFGHTHYTASIYQGPALTTTKILKGNDIHGNLTNYVKSCTAKISCRARCEPLHLLNGEVNCPSSQPMEGDECHFYCNNGYYLTGDTKQQCTGNGWTGTHTFCDGK